MGVRLEWYDANLWFPDDGPVFALIEDERGVEKPTPPMVVEAFFEDDVFKWHPSGTTIDLWRVVGWRYVD